MCRMQEHRTSFFDGLEADQLSEVLDQLEERRFPAGAVVLAEGDAPRELYIVRSGFADIYLSDRSDGERHIGRVGPGASLGEVSLFTGQPVSATVRAVEDLDVLAISEPEFHRIADRFPRVYRNLGTILSERLVRSDQRSQQSRPTRVATLINEGAPPLVGYALACSLAWHLRAPVALLVVTDGEPPEDLAALASRSGDGVVPAGDGRARAHLAIIPRSGIEPHGGLAGLVDRLVARHEHVLVQVPAGGPNGDLGGRTVFLSGAEGTGDGQIARSGGRLHAWKAGTGPRPEPSGVLCVPDLIPADVKRLQDGLLPPATAAGRAVGWLARDLAGLKVGLALGAGSFKGYAHIGVVDVLRRAGIPIDYIAGTSIGGAVAALYAAGYGTQASIQILDRIGASAFRPTVPIRSLMSSNGLRASVRRMTGERRIEDLPVPLSVVATDIATQREVVFKRGLLWPALLASVSIPGIYPAQRMGRYILVDGGICNPVPSNVAADMGADVVIAVRLISRPIPRAPELEAVEAAGKVPSVLQAIMRSIEVMQSKISAETASAATIVIEPLTADTPYGWGLRNFSEGKRYVVAGEAAAREALPRIASALPWLRQ